MGLSFTLVNALLFLVLLAALLHCFSLCGFLAAHFFCTLIGRYGSVCIGGASR